MARLHQLASSMIQDTKIDPSRSTGSKTLDDASYHLKKSIPFASFLRYNAPPCQAPAHHHH